jgi:hypothetical protein
MQPSRAIIESTKRSTSGLIRESLSGKIRLKDPRAHNPTVYHRVEGVG